MQLLFHETTTVSHAIHTTAVGSGKLLLVLASTVIIGSESDDSGSRYTFVTVISQRVGAPIA
jgi:hypothetical protein